MKVRDEVWAHVQSLARMTLLANWQPSESEQVLYLRPALTSEQARKMLRVELSWEDAQSVLTRMGGGERIAAHRELDESGNMRFSQDGVTYYVIPGMTGYKIINPMEKAQ